MEKPNRNESYECIETFELENLAFCLSNFYGYKAERDESLYHMKQEIIDSLFDYFKSFESCSPDNPPHYSFTHNDINICYAAICFALAQYEMSNADDFVRQYIEENHDELLQLRGIFRNFLSLFE